MPSFFVDSSALVKRYRNEPGSQRVSSLIDGAEHLTIARLTKVEVSAALVCRVRRARVPAERVKATLAAFDEEILRSFDIVELGEGGKGRWGDGWSNGGTAEKNLVEL